jgi:hypothetical protein
LKLLLDCDQKEKEEGQKKIKSGKNTLKERRKFIDI